LSLRPKASARRRKVSVRITCHALPLIGAERQLCGERSEGYKNGTNTVIVHCDVGTLSARATVILGS